MAKTKLSVEEWCHKQYSKCLVLFVVSTSVYVLSAFAFGICTVFVPSVSGFFELLFFGGLIGMLVSVLFCIVCVEPNEH